MHDFYRRNSQEDKAESTLENAVKLLPPNLNLTIKLASRKLETGDTVAAKNLYEQWLAHTPKTAVVQNNLASLLLMSEEKEDLEKALRLVEPLENSRIPHFLDTSGWAHYKNGQIQTAVRHLEQASKKLKGVPEFDYHLGMAYIAQGNLNQGEKMLKNALEKACLLYTSPSPRDQRGSRMPSSA